MCMLNTLYCIVLYYMCALVMCFVIDRPFSVLHCTAFYFLGCVVSDVVYCIVLY